MHVFLNSRFQPGLGNPVVKVEVREGVPNAPAEDRSGPAVAVAVPEPGADDAAELQTTLARISGRLAELERRLG